MTRVLLGLFVALVFSSAVAAGKVSRAQFTTGIIDREPVDQIITMSTERSEIKYFTELSDMQGENVTHQWVYKNQIMFEISFNVDGPRWRVWSSMSLQPGWTGTWFVNTIDEHRTTLSSLSFQYR